MDDAAAVSERERGWGRFLAALVAWMLVPATPWLNVITPIEQTWVLLVPAVAACMMVGWWGGGRLSLALLWAALAGWMLIQPIGGTSVGYDRLARGWGLLLAASFGAVSLLFSRRAFFARAVSAVAIAATVAGTVWLVRGGTSRPHELVTAEMTRRNAPLLAQWRKWQELPNIKERAANDTEVAALFEALDAEFRALPDVAGSMFVGLLAIESMAALALAWALYHRLSRARLGAPLAALRDFRFNDQLVWGVIVGAILVLLPAFAPWRTFGFNLLVFFGALYVVRGFGVLTWMAPSRIVMALMIGLALFGLPILGAVALGLGLGDTWVDWRNRPRPSSPTA
jgi:hypothetical protein